MVQQGVDAQQAAQLGINSRKLTDGCHSNSPSKRTSLHLNMIEHSSTQRMGLTINIRAMFPVKFLLRITSKKYDSSYLSFYFKVPNVDTMQLEHYKVVLDKFSKSSIRSFYDFARGSEFLTVIKQVLDKKDGVVGSFSAIETHLCLGNGPGEAFVRHRG